MLYDDIVRICYYPFFLRVVDTQEVLFRYVFNLFSVREIELWAHVGHVDPALPH